ncbi:hypothetical protein [Trichlorobacter sp.]|uniref:hypothetical protein n=1 Tax=Trichlorobacter sp. TaxID=2911007 RepID=UPI00243BD9D0|nr:hypothetical protein [Trichlorobacter sp.]MCK9333599.1 hypothetical protein [Candidatus Cloacimonadota bacterium]MDD2227704.1 hypothetical protein [Clostridia bacterium]MDY0385470.1 hypothetical protein [Trichlorobacter sp.]
MTKEEFGLLVKNYLSEKMAVDWGVLEEAEKAIDDVIDVAWEEVDSMGGDFVVENDMEEVINNAIYTCKVNFWEKWLHAQHWTIYDLANHVNAIWGKGVTSRNVIDWLINHDKSTADTTFDVTYEEDEDLDEEKDC